MKNFLRMLFLTISIIVVSTAVFATESYDTMLINEDFGYDTTIANGIVNDEIVVQLNGEVIDFTDENGNKVEPKIINDRTMVPMRKIFEVFGAEVSWIGETRSIKAKTEELEIGLQIDNNIATITNKSGDIEEIELDSAPVIYEDRTLVPVRFIAESLNKKVGFDAYDRAVIIIDTNFVEETLKEDASNLYEYLTTDFEKIETYEMNIDIDGKVKYVDSEIRSNNTSLNLVGEMDIKLSETAMALELDLSITGKGTLIEEVKEEGLQKIKFELIVDAETNAAYIKLNFLEGYEDKYIKYEIDEDLKELFNTIRNQSNMGVQTLVDALIPEDSLTLYSYSELQTMLQMITTIMGNDNFKVSGRNTKTYKFNLDLSDILETVLELAMSEDEIEYEDTIDFEMAFEVKVSDKVAKESNYSIVLDVTREEENAKVELEALGKLKSYNKEVEIEIPEGKDVIEMYE